MKILKNLIFVKYCADYHLDSLYKARRNGVSKKLAKQLEGVTGIPRLKWLYPDEYGDAWKLWDRMKANLEF